MSSTMAAARSGQMNVCKTCGIIFMHQKHFEEHQERFHGTTSNREQFVCGECGLIFAAEEIVQHESDHDLARLLLEIYNTPDSALPPEPTPEPEPTLPFVDKPLQKRRADEISTASSKRKLDETASSVVSQANSRQQAKRRKITEPASKPVRKPVAAAKHVKAKAVKKAATTARKGALRKTETAAASPAAFDHRKVPKLRIKKPPMNLRDLRKKKFPMPRSKASLSPSKGGKSPMGAKSSPGRPKNASQKSASKTSSANPLGSACPFCNETFPNRPWQLSGHMVEKHSVSIFEIRKREMSAFTDRSETFKKAGCPLCMTQFETASKCLGHMLDVHRQKLFASQDDDGECQITIFMKHLKTVKSEEKEQIYTISVRVRKPKKK